MRAKRSCPRSSVPKGCLSEGPWSRAPKSISLIGVAHSQGLTRTAVTITARIIAPRKASLWRRKRRHASLPHRACGRTGAPPARLLAVSDAGVEPAIDDVGEESEENHEGRQNERYRHDHRRIDRKDRADERRSDARHAEDLLGHDGSAEDSRHLQRHQRDDGNESVAQRVLDDHYALAQAFGAGGRH